MSSSLHPNSQLMMIPTEERNPLMMEDVLEHVFGYLDREMGTLRLVCKTWTRIATRSLGREIKAFPVKGHFGWDGAEVVRLRGFLDTMANSALLPFTQYNISTNVLIKPGEVGMTEEFFRLCGPDMTSLVLHHYECSMEGRLAMPREVKLHALKKLRIVVHLHHNVLEHSKLRDFYLLVELILDSCSSSLLEFDYCVATIRGTGQLEQFEHIIHSKIPLSIRTLMLGKFSNNELLFRGLMDMELQLRALTLSNNVRPASGWERDNICKFLKGLSPSLWRLEIQNGYPEQGPGCFSPTLPMLQNLASLKLSGVELAPFVVSRQFPKLTSLDVMGCSSEYVSSLLITGEKESSTSVTELWLPWDFSAKHLAAVSKHFPHIRELHVGGACVEMVPLAFPRLNSLEISFPDWDFEGPIIDSLLCGISIADCKQIRRLTVSEFMGLNGSELQRVPSLLSLILLEKLKILNYGPDGPSDISAQFLFLVLPRLKELYILRCRVSPGYRSMLDEQICRCHFEGLACGPNPGHECSDCSDEDAEDDED